MKKSTGLLMILLSTLALNGCGEYPEFPNIQLCKPIIEPTPRCRCTEFYSGVKTNHEFSYCNLSVPAGDWAKVMDYVKSLERQVKGQRRIDLMDSRQKLERVSESL